ncbi:MAG: hypothetical protein ACR2JG_10905, partial [Geodermatophilaceae bacterium]
GLVSGPRSNPVVSAAAWLLGWRTGTALRGRAVAPYSMVQIFGGSAGAVLANAMYDLPAIQISASERSSGPVLLAEIVATAGLVAVIFALLRSGRAVLVAAAVGAYIGAAYWFTSSTSFANPAVTVGRIFSDTFAGIAPSSVTAFILAQVVGGGLGVLVVRLLYPTIAGGREDVTAHIASDPRGSDTREA